MPTKPVQTALSRSAQRVLRKAEILRALQRVCAEVSAMPAATADRGLYREVGRFLGQEIRRLQGNPNRARR